MRALVVSLALLAGCAHADLPRGRESKATAVFVPVQPPREPVWIRHRAVRVPGTSSTVFSEHGVVPYSEPGTHATLWLAKRWDELARMLGEETTWTGELLLATACRKEPICDETRARAALLVDRSWQPRETWNLDLGDQHWANMRATDGAFALEIRCPEHGDCSFELRRDRVLVIGWAHHRWPEHDGGRWRSTTAWFGNGASVEVGSAFGIAPGDSPRADHAP